MIRPHLVPLAMILASFGCGSKAPPPGTLPSDPTTALVRFLAAVKANDIQAMGDLWGSDKGPANAWMAHADRERRLTVIRATLAFESYAIDRAGPLPGPSDRERVVRVQLVRNNCRPTVPFTMLQYRDGWLINRIDLDAAGNPRRPCP